MKALTTSTSKSKSNIKPITKCTPKSDSKSILRSKYKALHACYNDISNPYQDEIVIMNGITYTMM